MSLASWFRNLVNPSPRSAQVEVGRNDACWCGSGKKYKRCHLKSDELKRVEASYSAQLTNRQRMSTGVMPGKAKPRRIEKAATPAEKR